MNRQFTLPATPALARRLMLLANIKANVECCPAIRTMAAHDLIATFPTDFTAAQCTALQYIADHQFRAIVLAKELTMARATVLHAAQCCPTRPIMIHSSGGKGGALATTMAWMPLLRSLNLPSMAAAKASKEPFDGIYIGNIYQSDYLMKAARNGVLIIDLHGEPNVSEVDALSKEFARFIVAMTPTSILKGTPASRYPTPQRQHRMTFFALEEAVKFLVPDALLSVFDAFYAFPELTPLSSLLGISTHLL